MNSTYKFTSFLQEILHRSLSVFQIDLSCFIFNQRGVRTLSKQLYIVISQTGTLLSRVLKLLTKAEYNHASISLLPDLNTMYSFGRLNPYNPFIGGFVQESPDYGTFKRFYNTKVVVLSVTVTDEQHEALQSKLDTMLLNKAQYHYNYLGLFLAGVHIHYHQRYHYYCSEFVKDMLVSFGVPDAEKLNAIIQPIHFLELPNVTKIYCGKLTDYNTAIHPSNFT